MFEKSKPLIGFWCQFFDQFAIRKICNLNYDWLALDMEHGVYNYKDVCVLTSIIKDYGKIPFVRLNKSNEESVQKSLDSGASGLILPMIENPSSLKKLIKKSSYPPIGNRSVGFSNSNMFGLNLSNDLNSKSRPYIVIQIESVSGVDNLSDLINVLRPKTTSKGKFGTRRSIDDIHNKENNNKSFDHKRKSLDQ